MKCKKIFNYWLNYFSKNTEVKSELEKLKSNESEIFDRFSSDLKFGTAGLRGIMGIGTNMLNIYTIRKATQGLSNYILDKSSSASVCISFDSRINSELFARETAKVLAANKIKVFITKKLAPTPFLSFATRNLECTCGIMITASHNPAEYNGYKCYNENGTQMPTETTEKVYEYIKKVDIFDDIKISDFENELKKGNIKFIEDGIYLDYKKQVLDQSINKEALVNCPINVTYTPLNGAGRDFVKDVLSLSGVKNLNIVKLQENPDGNFPTCKYPNPEILQTFDLASKEAKKNSSDIIIATDPDSDRIGIMVFHNGKYQMLTGNQIGILLFYYIVSQKKEKSVLPEKSVAIRTLVSSKMIDKIASDYNCNVLCVPTGFKNIGEKIENLEKIDQVKSFIFGFEESNGYLTGTYARDKDAVSSALLICEMASFYKNISHTLIDVLEKLYEKYGFYLEKTISFEFSGVTGSKKIESIMQNFRNPPDFNSIGNKKIASINDYQNSISLNLINKQKSFLNFPKLDIVEFTLDEDSQIIIRPSGTEPKLKVYIMTNGKNKNYSKALIELIESDLRSKIKDFN